jgi:hypothetical protein
MNEIMERHTIPVKQRALVPSCFYPKKKKKKKKTTLSNPQQKKKVL